MQNFRSYATEAAGKPSSATPWIVGAAAIGAGIAGYSFLGGKKASAGAAKPSDEAKKAVSENGPVPKTFTGGEQGFIDLKLAEVIPYNHNTKRFKFELPEKDQVSGLTVACERSQPRRTGRDGTLTMREQPR